MWPPASLPPFRGKVPPKGADEGDYRELPGSFVGAAHLGRPQASPPSRGKVAPKGTDEGNHRELPGSFVGAAHLGRPPNRSHILYVAASLTRRPHSSP